MSTLAHPAFERFYSDLPITEVQEYTGEPIESEGLVEFRLLYSGPLKSSGNRSRPESVHALRREFHPQLRRLWQTKSTLHEMACRIGMPEVAKGPSIEATWENPDVVAAAFVAGVNLIAQSWNMNGFQFVPLVTEDYCLRCSFDVLFLRMEKPGSIYCDGDIDGRVKTIFDALSIPRKREQANGEKPQEHETPFFVLLEDDKLVSEVHVTTDQLLQLPKEQEAKRNYVSLVIGVKLQVTMPHQYGWVFS